MNPAAPEKSFEALWAELLAVLPPGTKVAKYYGNPFTVCAFTEGFVTINSPDVGGEVAIPQRAFSETYANWRHSRYEALAATNTQQTLHVVSLIDHVIQTWVRREERAKLIQRARTTTLHDGVFWVVHYNNYGRHIGPRPSGHALSLSEVFPAHEPSLLSVLELAATKLFNARATAVEPLAAEHQGFTQEVYRSVVARNQLSEVR